MSDPISVVALYCFTRFDDPAAVRDGLFALARASGVRGTLLIASEGINGTIAGSFIATDAMLTSIRALPGCADLALRRSMAATPPFHRLKVRVKREIVTMGVAVDAAADAGTHVAPADWNALIADPGTVVIDTRNAYEVRIGSFAGAVNPGTAAFADFPAWFRAERARLLGDAPARVAMFCTGGIRCEKATAFLKSEGVAEVYHLQGGILGYLETISEADSRWRGECFVFDERVAVGHGLRAGSHGLCRGCRMPVSPADRSSPNYEAGVACPACYGTRDADQRAGYAERHRQVELATARGAAHVGADFSDQ